MHRGRITAIWMALLIALGVGLSAPAAAQSTASYKAELNSLTQEMRALWGELERFQVKARYCLPPGQPSKADDQAALDALEARVNALNTRYNSTKQSLNDFLAGNPRLYAELLANDVDPRNQRWWTRYETSRKKMLDELRTKKDALAKAREVDCSPKPKAKPMTAGPPPPPLPVRPSIEPLGWPAMPPHFCSWDEYWKFINEQINPRYNKVAENAEKAARFRTQVEVQVNNLVQADKPIPPALAALRRQAIADVAEQDRLFKESEEIRRRAKAIPVIDCRTPVSEPPRQDMRTGQTPAPPQRPGVALSDERQIAQQQRTIDNVEAGLAELRTLRQQGRCGQMIELADDLDEWLGELGSTRPGMIRSMVVRPPPPLPPGQVDKWRAELDEIMDDCPDPSRLRVDPRALIFLGTHNQVRAEIGLPPLKWDPQLAAGAAAHANYLARTGQLTHAPREGRGTVRENFSRGLIGWGPQQMMGNWVKEKRNFVPGVFPNVTTTGRWEDIAHYSQMIWPTTTKLGCGMASGSGFQWLVCRYDPGGNKDGKAVGVKPPMPQLRGEVGRQNPQQPVIANQDGIAPATSTTPTGPPPPPPPPTARDEAPEGNEAMHPLVSYFTDAVARHAAAVDCGDKAAAEAELAKMRYALDQLRKRLKAAKKAGPYSAVKPDDVQRQVNDMEQKLDAAQRRLPGGGLCPPMPQPRGVIGRQQL